MNLIKKFKPASILSLLGGVVCFLYNPGAAAQVVVAAKPVVNPQVKVNSNFKVNANGNANPQVNVNPNVNPVINVNPNFDISPDINVDPEINVDIDIRADRNEGSWFATIKDDKIRIEFRSGNDEEHNWNSTSTFKLSDFPTLPKGGEKGDFSLKREAGIMAFSGKFDGDMGFGHYKFTPDASFVEYVKSTVLPT